MNRDHDRWRRLEAAFDLVMELPAATRSSHIGTQYGDTPDFAADLDRMVRAAEGTDSLLDTDAASFAGPAVDLAVTSALPPQLGPWRLIREIGRGGMGVVYLAERGDQEYQQRAAVKLLHSKWDADRLRAERQILASLQHANIAAILDGGSSPDGQPYLVMEYVEGQPFHEYCREHALAQEQRLDLFLQVCDAVHHAHQRLVVHRDLKPSNILVDAESRVRLLDFGIAKVMDPGVDAPDGSHTLVFTPDYAAPEQIEGKTITTATDVYALGVLLYELLCGERPHNFEGMSASAIERVLSGTNPAPPSTRGDADTGTDLDTVCLKALRPEPDQRYGSARELAEDIRRYLRGMPVEARPATLRYRAGKFVGRHRAGVGVAGLLVAASLAFVVTLVSLQRETSLARNQAELDASRAGALSDFLLGLFEASQPGSDNPDSIPVTRLLEAGETQATSLGGQPELQAALWDAIGQARRGLGEYDAAVGLLGQSVALYDSLEQLESRPALATRLHLATALHQAGDLKGALGHAEWAAEHVDEEALAGMIGATRGGILIDLGEHAAAESILANSVEVLSRTRGEDEPVTLHALNNLAMARSELGDNEGTLATFERILSLRRSRYGERHQEVASALVNVSYHRKRVGDLAGTESALREALAIRRELLGDAHPDLARVLDNLGVTLGMQGRLDEAEPLFRESLQMRETLLGAGHPSLASAWNNLAMLESRRGNHALAVENQRHSLDLREQALGPRHVAIAQGLTNLADFLCELDRHDDAFEATHRAISIYADQEGRPPGLAAALVQHARALRGQGNLADAEAAAAHAVDLEREEGNPRTLAYALAIHGGIAGARGDLSLATAELDSALQLHGQAMGEDHPRTQWIREQRDALGP